MDLVRHWIMILISRGTYVQFNFCTIINSYSTSIFTYFVQFLNIYGFTDCMITK